MDEATQGPSEPQASYAPDTQYSSGSGSQHFPEARAAESRIPDSMEVDTQVSHYVPRSGSPDQYGSMAPPATTRSGARSKLKRRAGATQSSFLDNFDTTVHYEEEVKKQQKAREIRDLYEETRGETASLSTQPSKRQRTNAPPAESMEQLMEIDEEEDIVTKNIRTARPKRGASPVKPAAQPAKKAPAPVREETPEEVELVEPVKKGKKGTAKTATKSTTDGTQQDAPPSQVDKDEAFLQAIKTSKKKGMDDMDREFNAMHIRKVQQKTDIDYSIVRDFTDDPRGNFIEIVRKDLFRHDPPRVSVPVADDGRPNFKKFKKVRGHACSPLTSEKYHAS